MRCETCGQHYHSIKHECFSLTRFDHVCANNCGARVMYNGMICSRCLDLAEDEGFRSKADFKDNPFSHPALRMRWAKGLRAAS